MAQRHWLCKMIPIYPTERWEDSGELEGLNTEVDWNGWGEKCPKIQKIKLERTWKNWGATSSKEVGYETSHPT